MNESIDIFDAIFATSLCVWGVLWLIIVIRIERFIVKRYENETGFLNTVFFKKHVPFARYLPDFFSSAIYNGHLIMCLWGWRFFRTKKVFSDVQDPYEIIGKFTVREIKEVKIHAISLLVLVVHGIVFYARKLL